MSKYLYIEHQVGEYDEQEMVQRCLVCGDEVVNNRGMMWPNGQDPPRGFAPGSLFISVLNNPKIYKQEIDDNFEDSITCKL